MITLHCTDRVRRRFKLDLDLPREPTGRLGNWYANLVNVGRGRWVICVSERSLLPVVIPARNADFPRSFAAALERVLNGIGVPSSVATEEASHGESLCFAKTENRSVLGSLNDFAFHFEFLLRRGLSPEDAVIDLAGMPCSPLELHFPDRTVFNLLAIPARSAPLSAAESQNR